MVLCGVRDVRDYRIHSNLEQTVVAGGSAFNVKARSLRLGDFSRGDVSDLLAQHTRETGQEFSPQAVETIWMRTRGQPWLVNALADETCFRRESGRDRSRAIDADDVRDAEEVLIARRETHLDQLADKLREDRVRRVVEPLLSGGDERTFSARDLEYVRDLGLVASDDPLRIANPVYAEVVPRELTCAAQAGLVEDTAWYVDAGGGLDLVKLLSAFQAFFPGAFGALDGALRLPGGRPAAPASGVSSTHRQRRRAHRAGVWPGPTPDRSPGRLAARRACAQIRHRVQDPSQEFWSGRSATGWSRPWATWIVAGRKRGTS